MKIGDNYKIAIAFTVLPFVVGRFFTGLQIENIKYLFFTIALVSILIPKFGNFIFYILGNTGKFLGDWIARVILLLVWFFAVLPTGILMKIAMRDRLKLKKQETASYWIDNEYKNSDYENQF